MAPRAHWKGYLRLALVTCPISLYPAISAAEKISFRQVNRETGNRLRQQLVDSVTGKVVEAQEKGRGYEVGNNQYAIVPDEELVAAQREARSRPFTATPVTSASSLPLIESSARPPLRVVNSRKVQDPEPEAPPRATAPRPIPENTHTIELDRFVPRDEIDPRYFLTPYYVAPNDEVGQEAFALIRNAMERRELVGMGRVVLANRERPIILEPMGLGLRGFTLHYAHEVRAEAEYFADIRPLELPDELTEVTDLIMDTKRGSFDPAYLEDRYRTVLVEKLRQKQAQVPEKSSPSEPSARNVVSLMEALKASLATAKPPAPSKSRGPARRTSTSATKTPPKKRGTDASRSARR